jgi:hypothetical protein
LRHYKVPQRSNAFFPHCKIHFCIVQFLRRQSAFAGALPPTIDRVTARKLVCVKLKLPIGDQVPPLAGTFFPVEKPRCAPSQNSPTAPWRQLADFHKDSGRGVLRGFAHKKTELIALERQRAAPDLR